MNCKELVEMIYLQALNMKEQLEECKYQSDASKLRVTCVKMRHDLNVLNKKLGNFRNE